ncbi:benzyl alcohol O-benzoyltransferase-like [Lolium rigidum]|uniref:benzyl alcohol O-benzoyltransferase-like n=1 Tax=Lolium rigidum TaxID=89674 RepID=UPI001F5CC3D4|nr:benzyl alcohol O-benzoyltransferase-like [Lolium rigidum]
MLTPPVDMLKHAKERVYTPTLAYAVRRRDPELIRPAAHTPRETKRLSDIDNQEDLRTHVSLALFYRGGQNGVDPAGLIRRALGEALVQYYPLAGRLREVEGQKLVVDCNGEGVLFVEADGDVRLVELEAVGLRPPFPCWDQLLFDVQGSSGVIDCPLLHIQVTRLLCGSFVFALRFNHVICDGIGIAQFMNAIAELTRGLPSPTIAPVWSRELLNARDPPMPSFTHREFDLLLQQPPPAGDMVIRSFTFGASDLDAIKKSLPPLLRDTATTFEALAAFLGRARAAALELPLGGNAPLMIVVNIRGVAGTNLPAGYYGNACVPSTVLVDPAVLLGGSLGDAVALVRRAKATVTSEYARSIIDEMVLLGRRFLCPTSMFVLSDARHLGFARVDFGWGEPVYAGPADTAFGVSSFISGKDRDGEDAVVVPVVLPWMAMDRFATEVERLLNPVKPQLS